MIGINDGNENMRTSCVGFMEGKMGWLDHVVGEM